VLLTANSFLPAAGYLLVEFYSDASISAPGFKLSFAAASEPAAISCPAGQRLVTLLVRTRQADVYDMGWMVLPDGTDLKAAAAKSVLAAGGYLPEEAPDMAVSAEVLLAADELSQDFPDYRTWSVATEQRCLAPGKYSLVLLATDASTWDGSSVTIAVPGKTILSQQQMQAGKVMTSTAFEVPAGSDNAVVARPRDGSNGFQADITIAGNYSGDDFRGVVLGVLQTAVARATSGVAQDVVITGVKNGSASASGRRMMEAAAAAAAPAQSPHAQAAASAAARSKRASELSKVHGAASTASKASKGARGTTAESSKPAASAAIIKGAKLPGKRGSAGQGSASRAKVAAGATVSSRRRLQQAGTAKAYPGAVVSIKVVGKCSCHLGCPCALCWVAHVRAPLSTVASCSASKGCAGKQYCPYSLHAGGFSNMLVQQSLTLHTT
jgi:hypothetical protein